MFGVETKIDWGTKRVAQWDRGMCRCGGQEMHPFKFGQAGLRNGFQSIGGPLHPRQCWWRRKINGVKMLVRGGRQRGDSHERKGESEWSLRKCKQTFRSVTQSWILIQCYFWTSPTLPRQHLLLHSSRQRFVVVQLWEINLLLAIDRRSGSSRDPSLRTRSPMELGFDVFVVTIEW